MHLVALPALNDNYIWLFADDTGSALVVDPGEAAPVDAAVQRGGWHLTTILITHHHPDHAGAAADLGARHGARIIAPSDARIPTANERVGDGAAVALNGPHASFEVLDVPGHTSSHIAFVGENILFCGDTLFSLGCGRLFEGTPEQMLASLDRLASLPDATRVCCGHEYTLANAAFARTVEPDNADLAQRTEQARQARDAGLASLPAYMGDERKANPFLRVDVDAVMTWADNNGTDQADRVARFAALRQAKDLFRS